MAKAKRRAGRPSLYTPSLGAKICERMSSGESLRSICRESGMPDITTVLSWALGVTEDAKAGGFPEHYARARELRSELYADEIVEISDDDDVDPQRLRLRVDARKWVASKLLPKTYGERLSHEHSGPDGGPITTRDETVDLSKLSTETLRKVREELGEE